MKIALLAILLIPFSFRATPPTVRSIGFQSNRWHSAQLNRRDMIALDQCVALYLRHRETYERLERLRPNGVPAPVIFALHYRESSNNFGRHLHEGSRLTHRTLYVPKNRLPPPKNPPYDFVTSAEDALYTYEKLDKWDWNSMESALQASESYNGLGYQRKGVPSPYLWSGTNQYTRGKYVADGRYSDTAVDQQLGVVAILKRMIERGISVKFAS